MKKFNRMLSFLLALVMVFGMFPAVTAQAAENGGELAMLWARNDGEGWYMSGDLYGIGDTSFGINEPWYVYFAVEGEGGYTPVPVECDNEHIILRPLNEDEVRGDQDASLIYELKCDDMGQVEKTVTISATDGSNQWLSLFLKYPDIGFYTGPVASAETLVKEYEPFPVDPYAEENALYLIFGNQNDFITNLEPVDDTVIHTEQINAYTWKVVVNPDLVWESAVSGDEFEVSCITKGDGEEQELRHGRRCAATVRVPHLSFGWLEHHGEGWFENADGSGWDTGINVNPVNYFRVIFYANYQDEEGQWHRTPVEVSSSDNIICQKITDRGEDIREGEANAEYFYYLQARDWEIDSTISAEYNGQTLIMNVSSFREYDHFYSQPEIANENVIDVFTMDPYAEENIFYFGFEGRDGWSIRDVWYDNEETDVEKLDNGMYKITVLPEKVQDACANNYSFVPYIEYEVVHEEGYEERWGKSIECLPGARLPYLSNSWIQWSDDGVYDNDWENESRDMQLTPLDTRHACFYYNHYNEDGEWVSEPVHVTSSNENLKLTPMMGRETIRESEANGEYFYELSVSGDSWDQTYYVTYEGVSYPVYIRRDEAGFFSKASMKNENYINTLSMDVLKDEHVIYFGLDSDHWKLISFSETSQSGEELPGTDKASLVRMDNGMYKIKVFDDGSDFDLHFSAIVEDPNGYQEEWIVGLWCWQNHPTSAANLWINGDRYEIYEGSETVGIHQFQGHDEDGNERWEFTTGTLPDGVSYDLNTNTLTLNNANLSQLGVFYSGDIYDEYDNYVETWYNLPNADLTIKLIGKNTIKAENRTAFEIGDRLNATITGNGSLYVSSPVDSDHHHDVMAVYGNTTLTIGGNVQIQVETSGEHYWTNEDGNPEAASMYAIRGGSDCNLILKDNAKLTTIMPEDNIESLCIYGGIVEFDTVRIEGGYLEANGGIQLWNSGDYIQTGGEVKITPTNWGGVDDGQRHYFYSGINAEGGRVDISGGKLTIDATYADKEAWWGDGISIGNGSSLSISGGEIEILTDHRGCAISIGNDCEGTISGGKVTVTAPEWDADWNDITGIYTNENAVINLTGGEIILNNVRLGAEQGTYNISGADVTANASVPAASGYSFHGIVYMGEFTQLNVTRGSLTIDTMNICSGLELHGGEMNISGGTVAVNAEYEQEWLNPRTDHKTIAINSSGDLNITGGTVTLNGYSGYNDYICDHCKDAPSLTISDGEVNMKGFISGGMARGKVTLSGGSLTAEATHNEYGCAFVYYLSNPDDSDCVMNITGGDHLFKAATTKGANNFGLYNYMAEINITGGNCRMVGTYAAVTELEAYELGTEWITVGEGMHAIPTGGSEDLEFVNYHIFIKDDNGDDIYDYRAFWYEYDNVAGNYETGEGVDPVTDVTVTHICTFKDGFCTICGAEDPNYVAAPTLKASRSSSTGKVTLKWNAVEGAEKYELYQSTDGKNWEILSSTTKTSITHNSAEIGQTYSYYVVAVAKNDAKSADSNIVTGTRRLTPPTVTLNNATPGKITIIWKKIDGAVAYDIYRATSENGNYARIKSNYTGTSLTNTSGIEAGKTYYYKVMALSSNTAGNSTYSNIESIVCKLASPEVTLSNLASSGKIKVSWSKVTGASKYEVWYATSKTGKYTRATTTSSASYTHSGAKAGTTYYYYVIAVGSDVKSGKSNIVNRTCVLAQPQIGLSNVASSGKIKVSWEKIDGAVKYEVHRATSKTGTYTKLTTTTKSSYTDSSASAGKTYYYKVKALASKSAADSAYSDVTSRMCDLAQPKIELSNIASSGKIKVSWGKVSGAAKYEVYRATSKTGTYKKLTTATSTSYTDSSATAGKTYYYKVKAIHSKSDANSAYSAVANLVCDLKQPSVTIKLNSKGKPALDWKDIDGATKYKVYIYNSNGKLTNTVTVTSSKYTHSSASKGKTYSYKVEALCKTTSATSAKSESVKIKSK